MTELGQPEQKEISTSLFPEEIFNGLIDSAKLILNHKKPFIIIFSMHFLLSLPTFYFNTRNNSGEISNDVLFLLVGLSIFMLIPSYAITVLAAHLVKSIRAGKLASMLVILKENFWDIPTFMLSSLYWGLHVFLGALLLFLPGVFLLYSHALGPYVAIFDTDNGDVSFKKSRSIVRANARTFVIVMTFLFGIQLSHFIGSHYIFDFFGLFPSIIFEGLGSMIQTFCEVWMACFYFSHGAPSAACQK